MKEFSMDFKKAAGAGIIGVLTLLQYVHSKRRKILEELERMPSPTNAREAHEICKRFYWQYFPFVATKALEFGLFKTYGIPSISSILNETRELIDNTNKRYDDTDILIREFLEHDPESKRAMVSLERMNFIHSHYQISNRDYLYVLAVFIVEPIVWIRKYGWRNPHPKEELAAYLRWKDIAEKMGIKSVPESFKDVEMMMEKYEERYMKYAESNKDLSESTMKLLLSKIPFKSLHPTLLHPIIAALCPDRLRRAMGLREPSNTLQKLVPFALQLHSFLNRHFIPPRSSPILRCSESDSKYIPLKPGVQNTTMLYTNFDEYEATYKNGYRIEELGPHHMSEKHCCPMLK